MIQVYDGDGVKPSPPCPAPWAPAVVARQVLELRGDDVAVRLLDQWRNLSRFDARCLRQSLEDALQDYTDSNMREMLIAMAVCVKDHHRL